MASDVRLLAGVVVDTGSGLAVNIDGALPDITWPLGYSATVGDPVRVLQVDGQMHLLSAITGPPPSPVVPVDPPEAPAPPPTIETGMTSVRALQSGTFELGGSWNRSYGDSVRQYHYGSSADCRGGWFYGASPSALQGRTVGALRLRLGSRLRIGSYNSALTAHIYLLDQATRPSGDATRIDGPIDVSIPAGSSGQSVTLPASWGQQIADGDAGGIGIYGSPYLGFEGLSDDPDSGRLDFDWRIV